MKGLPARTISAMHGDYKYTGQVKFCCNVDEQPMFSLHVHFLRRDAEGWGNALQAGMSRVWFRMGSLGVMIDLIQPEGCTTALGSTERLTETSTRAISKCKGEKCVC